MTLFRNLALVSAASLTLASCASSGPEMETVDYVDLERFVGDWYVIANIPTFLEKGAHNAVETYELNDDGTIATTFVFRDGGLLNAQSFGQLHLSQLLGFPQFLQRHVLGMQPISLGLDRRAAGGVQGCQLVLQAPGYRLYPFRLSRWRSNRSSARAISDL